MKKNAPANHTSTPEIAIDDDVAVKEAALEITPTPFVDVIDYPSKSGKFDQKQIERVLVGTPDITQTTLSIELVQNLSFSQYGMYIEGSDGQEPFRAKEFIYYYQVNNDFVMNTNLVHDDNGAVRASFEYPENECHPILKELKEKYIKGNSKKPDSSLDNAEAYEQPYDGWTFKLIVDADKTKQFRECLREIVFEQNNFK